MKINRIEAFQVQWHDNDPPAARSAFVRIWSDEGHYGIGEISPMQGAMASLAIVEHHLIPELLGMDPFDQAVIQDSLLHRFVKLGPEGALSGALAGIDIALWDLKGRALGLPVYKLLGGAWRTEFPFYASIGGNSNRTVDEVLQVVEARLSDQPAAIKLRFDNLRVDLDSDLSDHIKKARAVRKLVGDDFPLAFDANNGYSMSGAMRVGRELEALGYWWFEEPVQHYHYRATGELANKLSITVSAGEQTYTLAGLAELMDAGVRMVQPDPVKMGGITGLLRCQALAQAHGVELVSHQTQPTVGHMANMHICAVQLHATKPLEHNDPSDRTHSVFVDPPRSDNGLFRLPSTPGLGLDFDDAALAAKRIDVCDRSHV